MPLVPTHSPKERWQFLTVSLNCTFSSCFTMLKETETHFVNVCLNATNCFFPANYCPTKTTIIDAGLEFNSLPSLLLLLISVFLICFQEYTYILRLLLNNIVILFFSPQSNYFHSPSEWYGIFQITTHKTFQCVSKWW